MVVLVLTWSGHSCARQLPNSKSVWCCSLLARFFKILLQKARIEDELQVATTGGANSRGFGNGAGNTAVPPAATRPEGKKLT